MDKLIEFWIPLFIALLLVIIPIGGVWVLKSHFEARSYNRLTDGDATTWDAMWVELRVDGNR